MPVQLGHRHLAEPAEARIEIIPLIDIMFFLLAAFMLVSLSLVNVKSVPVQLPVGQSNQAEARQGLIQLSVDPSGLVYLDQKPLGRAALAAALAARRQTNASLRVLISGDRETRHGDMIAVLESVRAAGLERVAFAIRPLPASPP